MRGSEFPRLCELIDRSIRFSRFVIADLFDELRVRFELSIRPALCDGCCLTPSTCEFEFLLLLVLFVPSTCIPSFSIRDFEAVLGDVVLLLTKFSASFRL